MGGRWRRTSLAPNIFSMHRYMVDLFALGTLTARRRVFFSTRAIVVLIQARDRTGCNNRSTAVWAGCRSSRAASWDSTSRSASVGAANKTLTRALGLVRYQVCSVIAHRLLAPQPRSQLCWIDAGLAHAVNGYLLSTTLTPASPSSALRAPEAASR